LISELADARAGIEIAVTEGESTHTGPMSTYDLIVEKGPYRGLEPLGQTQALMNPDRSDEASDRDPLAELALDVGFGVGIAVVLILLYLGVSSLLFSVLGMTALPGTALIPHNHAVNVHLDDGGQTVFVNGSTPADELTLQYVNQTNSTNGTTSITVVSEDTFSINDKHNLAYNNSSIPANATGVRVQYSKFILKWNVAPGNGTQPLNARSNASSDASNSTLTATSTSTATLTATPTSTQSPTNTSTPTSTQSPTNTSTPTNTTTPNRLRTDPLESLTATTRVTHASTLPVE
jgi:hypothetical protein